MNKSIVIIANNRIPELHKLRESLGRLDLSGWRIFLHSEPPGLGTECFRDITQAIYINPYRMGSALNHYAAMFHAFEYFEADFVLCIEEDTVVGADFMDLVNWFAKDVVLVPEVMGMSAFAGSYTDKDDPKLMCFNRDCGVFAFGMHWHYWEKIFRGSFLFDCRGWQHSVVSLLKLHPNRYVATPAASRCTTCGQVGTFCTKELWERDFKNIVVYDGPAVDYRFAHPAEEIISVPAEELRKKNEARRARYRKACGV